MQACMCTKSTRQHLENLLIFNVNELQQILVEEELKDQKDTTDIMQYARNLHSTLYETLHLKRKIQRTMIS
jgi:hypothetical protein